MEEQIDDVQIPQLLDKISTLIKRNVMKCDEQKEAWQVIGQMITILLNKYDNVIKTLKEERKDKSIERDLIRE